YFACCNIDWTAPRGKLSEPEAKAEHRKPKIGWPALAGDRGLGQALGVEAHLASSAEIRCLPEAGCMRLRDEGAPRPGRNAVPSRGVPGAPTWQAVMAAVCLVGR